MFLPHVLSYSQDSLVLAMDSKDKSNNFKKLSDLHVNNRRHQAKLLHPSSRRHSLASTYKRSRFIRQKRIYSSVDIHREKIPDMEKRLRDYYAAMLRDSSVNSQPF